MPRTALSRVAASSLAVAALLGLAVPAAAETTLRVAMTVADIPQTISQPDQGGEGWRFMGVTAYDSLVQWDLSTRGPSKLIPGLATEWVSDPADRRKWTFKLRQGVKFHDGSAFDADSVIWNFDKLVKKDAPQYDPRQGAQTLGRVSAFESYRKIDGSTVEITTKVPDALLPYYLTIIWFASPAQWDKLGKSWAEFAKTPSGTGPWKLTGFVPRERADLVKNADYWDAKRIPRTDKLVLLPIPDASTRTSALLSGRVDWVEAPSPDAIPRLKEAGMQIASNVYPHIWPYHLSRLPDSPWNDVRVRKAANLAIDRDGLVKLLGGMAQPAVGQVPPDNPWFGTPSFKIGYDIKAAQKLMTEAGYGPNKPMKTKFLISPAGSGQMQPLPMNEYIQETLKQAYIDVEFETMDWQALRSRRASGAHAPENKGAHGLNNSWSSADPDLGFTGVMDSKKVAPNGNNWGNVKDPVLDDLSDRIRNEFDAEKQDTLLAQMHTRMVDEAVWIWVVHDLNPRAMSPKVRGFVSAQNWIQDLTTVEMK